MATNNSNNTSSERDSEKLETQRLQELIGNNISKLRKARDMNQSELAIKMNNRDRQVVQRLEKGKTNCSLNLLRIVAEALEVDLAELFQKSL